MSGRPASRAVEVLSLLVCAALVALGQAKRGESPPLKLTELVNGVDVVAYVTNAWSGVEHYPESAHSVRVLLGFKGTGIGESVIFGPHRYIIGSEDFVFLQRGRSRIGSRIMGPVLVKLPPTVDESGVSEARVVPLYYSEHEYGIMQIQYVCVFDKEPASSCDYGVKVNIRHVALPKNLAIYSAETTEQVDGDLTWVRRDALISILHDLTAPK